MVQLLQSNLPLLMLFLTCRLPKVSHANTLKIFLSGCVSDYRKLNEETVFAGKYRSIVRRDILMPDNLTIAHFDVLHQTHESVGVFVWDTATCTATLVEEYHPGIESMMIGTVAGMFEPEKHSSALQCAQFELEEEAQLQSHRWIPLLRDERTSTPFDKYSNNRMHPFLALDCSPVASPRSMDPEESIALLRGVSYTELMRLIDAGAINALSSYTILMGIRKLRELGIPLHKPQKDDL